MARKAKNEQPERVPMHAIANALAAFGGDKNLAADLLSREYPEVDAQYLRVRVNKCPQLRALYNGKSHQGNLPGEAEQASRKGVGTSTSMIVESNPMLAGEIVDQDIALLAKGLKAAGISESAIEKLEALGKFTVHGGKLLATTLELTNRMTSVVSVQLFDRMQSLEVKIEKLSLSEKEEDKAEYRALMKLRNQCHDLILKSQDRATNGTVSLMKLRMSMNSKGGSGRANAKPSPSPVNQAPAHLSEQ